MLSTQCYLSVLAEEEIIALLNLELRTDAEESEGHVFEYKELIKMELKKSRASSDTKCNEVGFLNFTEKRLYNVDY